MKAKSQTKANIDKYSIDYQINPGTFHFEVLGQGDYWISFSGEVIEIKELSYKDLLWIFDFIKSQSEKSPDWIPDNLFCRSYLELPFVQAISNQIIYNWARS